MIHKVRNLVLTGFMGSGKSAVGRLLASSLGWSYVDTDLWIEEESGQSVAELFATRGEAHFRTWEARAAYKFGVEDKQVIATGGRLMLDPANALDIATGALTLCLTARPETLAARLQHDPSRRPLLGDKEPLTRIKTLMAERATAYGQFPAINTDGCTPEEVAGSILAGLESGRWEVPAQAGRHQLTVTYPGGAYPIVVGNGVLEDINDWLERRSALVTDSNVGPLWANRCPEMPAITVPAGERYKSLETVRTIYDEFLSAGMDRTAIVVALGGGVIGDMAGFAAATFMRGIDCLLCPTTLLAMVDASVGGKTGVDLPQGKNLVGAFRQPVAVIADIETLSTLPTAEFRAGLAEVVKHGLIASPVLLEQAYQGLPSGVDARPHHGGTAALRSMILRAILVKRDIVEEDPFENGVRANLNLGHTFAHAIENVTNYAVRHGEAVAMGLVAAADLSARLGHASPAIVDRVKTIVGRLGLPVRFPEGIPARALQEAMGRDKKKAIGELRFVLLRDIGDAFVGDQVPSRALMETLVDLGSLPPDTKS